MSVCVWERDVKGEVLSVWKYDDEVGSVGRRLVQDKYAPWNRGE
jgi:hypothetical protein